MKKILFITMTAFCLFSCKKYNNSNNSTDDGYAGYVYTSSNSSDGNSIIAIGRKADGTLTELPGSPYLTGGKGDAADGDFDHQWAIRIAGNYLFAVNAGGNPINSSISVFKIDRATGKLTHVDQDPTTPAIDNIDSRGVRAVSIAYKNIGGTNWILVGNQFANPHYEMDPAMPVGAVITTPLRNVSVYTFNESTGVMQYQSIGATYADGNNGGPCTVEFNSAGSKLAISTWGVPHFLTPDADLSVQKPGRLYIYNFSNGTLTQTGMYEETGVSGNIGFSWSPDDQYIYLANFNLHSSKEDHSITVHDGTTAAKIQNFETSSRNDEACWTWVSNDKKKLYAASFTSNDLSSFDIGADNKLSVSLNPNFVHRRNVPEEDTKDMHEAGNYLYVSGAFKSHSVSVFSRDQNSGKLTEIASSPYIIPSMMGKTSMQAAFMGLTGFEK